MKWTPEDHGDYDGLKGFTVVGADGSPVGTVVEVLHPQPDPLPGFGGHQLLVRGNEPDGPPGVDAVYVPEAAISAVEEGRIVLGVPAGRLGEQEWPTERG